MRSEEYIKNVMYGLNKFQNLHTKTCLYNIESNAAMSIWSSVSRYAAASSLMSYYAYKLHVIRL